MIPRKLKICKCGCGREGYIWSHGMLKECWYKIKPPKQIAKTPLKINLQPTGEGILFKTIASTRKCVSFVSGQDIAKIDGFIGINNFIHVLPKGQNKYPLFKLYEKNIVLGLWKEHDLYDKGTEEQRQKYAKEMLEDYGVIVDWDKLYALREELLQEYKLLK